MSDPHIRISIGVCASKIVANYIGRMRYNDDKILAVFNWAEPVIDALAVFEETARVDVHPTCGIEEPRWVAKVTVSIEEQQASATIDNLGKIVDNPSPKGGFSVPEGYLRDIRSTIRHSAPVDITTGRHNIPLKPIGKDND